MIAHESGVTSVVDPFGGSYYLERLTADLEAGAREYFETIDRYGGMVEAIEEGYPQREIADSAYRSQQAVEAGEQTIVGVNRYTDDAPADIPILQIDEQVERDQVARVADLRGRRDAAAAERTIDALRRAASGPANLMPFILDAVRAYGTVGEMCDALRDVWGEYEETPGV